MLKSIITVGTLNMKITSNMLIDNSKNGAYMKDTLKTCFSNEEFNKAMIASGYWDLPGMALIYDELKSFLEKNNNKLLLLIGEDPLIRAYQQIKPKIKDPKFPDDYIKTDLENLELKPEYQKVAELLLQYCSDDNNPSIEIRIYRNKDNPNTRFLHSKCYIFEGKKDAIGIIGSSNFTAKGLESNEELNYLETNNTVVTSLGTVVETSKSHHIWFYEKWEKSEVWNKIFLTEILKPSPLGKTVIKNIQNRITPHDIYIKYLQYFFDEIIDIDKIKSLEEFLPKEISKLEYQFTAVNQAYSIMKAHGGFILADVVGLGKTIVAALIIKKFLDEVSFHNKNKRVLIITPPAVKSSWIETITLFDKNEKNNFKKNIDFITIGKIESINEYENFELREPELFDVENKTEIIKNKNVYGLIIVDESHNFRNDTSLMYKNLDELIGQINPTPYIGLLSATPQNNSPRDLKNQIFLFQRDHQNTTLPGIPGRKLETYFSQKQKEFIYLRKQKNNQKSLIKLSADIREKVLMPLLVRRTRTDIKEWYKEDAKNLNFPQIVGPISINYEMSENMTKLFINTMDIIASYDEEKEHFVFKEKNLQYYRYRAIEFLKDEKNKKLYAKRSNVDNVSKRLARLMQIQLVKRLESSIAAFKKSLYNLKTYTDNMIQMLSDDKVFICPDLDVNEEIKKAGSFQEAYINIEKKMKNKKGNNRVFSKQDFDSQFMQYLHHDKKILETLYNNWTEIEYDPKLESFKNALHNTYFDGYKGNRIYFFDPKKNNPHSDEKKLVIFTEAIDTANAIENIINGINNASNEKKYSVLKITSENRERDKEKIKENFDENYENKKNDYNILITTDVLAEGINLHRSNTILNYDAPWNATRLMQRIGRVNRIGSKAECVYVYNFMPTAQSDKLIQLISIAHAKLQSFHSMFGEDNPVFTDDEEIYSFGEAPEKMDLVKLLEGEKTESEKYIAELRNFKNQNPQEYNRIKELKFPLFCKCRLNQQSDAASKQFAFFVVPQSTHTKAGGQSYLYIDDNIEAINHEMMIEILKVNKDKKASALSEEFLLKSQEVIEKYEKHINRMKTSVDEKKLQTETKGYIQKMLQNSSDEEIKSLLKLSREYIENGNLYVQKKIKKIYETYCESLNTPADNFELIKQSTAEPEKYLKHALNELNLSLNVTTHKGECILGLEL